VDLNLQLMTEIRDQWGGNISAACQASSVPPAFLAALVANESGGKPDAKRFEPNVLADLWQVLLGRKATYGSIIRADLYLYALPEAVPQLSRAEPAIDAIFSATFQRIDGLATSWGLTQVMGYHVLERLSSLQHAEDLIVPSNCLPQTVRMLAQFAVDFSLSLAADFQQLFACWNTGKPNGKTADPDYVSRGLARMRLYSQLPPPDVLPLAESIT
jgi:hypothetical protein